MKSNAWICAGLLISNLVWAADAGTNGASNPRLELGAHERLISILSTNDIHGGLEAGKAKDGAPMGGMAFWSGVASSIRRGVRARWGAERAGVLVVDAGDQFQGTLLSNFSEGVLAFSAMSELATRDASGAVTEAGYDAVVTGNHDYDFGPVGWLDDQVTAATPDQDSRGALKKALGAANFPLVSANTFYRDSIADARGRPVAVDGQRCKSAARSEIDWSRARRPEFLKPYVLKQVAGLRVALVGIDNAETPVVTTPANVSDLCFDDEVEAYRRVRAELAGKADVFVVIMHNGNTDTSFTASDFVKGLDPSTVDAVVAGHTHFLNNTRVGGVPVIQSGSGGLRFGRIDLVYDTVKREVVRGKTRSFGGIDLLHERCPPFAREFCAVTDGRVAYEGVPVVPNARITALLESGRKDVAAVAARRLGTAKGVIRVNRTQESPLANALTDSMREVSKADISFINAGGIRAPLSAGDFTYEDLYRVLPFNNHGIVVGPMGADRVVALLKRSVLTCGSFGALMQSGLRVRYERDCSRAQGQIDHKARLLGAETVDGEVIYDAERGGMVAPAGRTFSVATLDFLAAGGAGFDGFRDAPVISDIGIVREAIAEHYLANPVTLEDSVDGRWAERLPVGD